MSPKRVAALVAAVLVPLALWPTCFLGVPQAPAAYVGEWQAPGRTITISSQGKFRYEEQQDGRVYTLGGPIRAYEAAALKIGVPFWVKRLPLQQAPQERNGRWHMTLDGQTYERVN